jgi:large subunit ribosomal protein L9
MAETETKTARKRARRHNRGLPKGPHGGVELLLIQNVEHLGKQGEVVEVRPGYANNYLLPQGLATVATEHHKRMVEKHRAKLLDIEKSRLAKLTALAEEIAKANDEGHLYGSVGPTDIANALKQHDIHIAPDQVRLEGVLKELGLYTAKIHVGHDIDADLKVWVVPTTGEHPERPEEAAQGEGE